MGSCRLVASLAVFVLCLYVYAIGCEARMINGGL